MQFKLFCCPSLLRSPKEILENYWQRGLRGYGTPATKKKLLDACQETGMTAKQVKVGYFTIFSNHFSTYYGPLYFFFLLFYESQSLKHMLSVFLCWFYSFGHCQFNSAIMLLGLRGHVIWKYTTYDTDFHHFRSFSCSVISSFQIWINNRRRGQNPRANTLRLRKRNVSGYVLFRKRYMEGKKGLLKLH